MELSLESTWSLDIPARLLGTYEQELHEIIQRGKAARYDVIADVGCADGFYAVGLAMIHPAAHVFAYDTNPAAQRLTERNATLNGVSDRVHTGGTCMGETLTQLAKTATKMLVVCDCEGYELELFRDPQTIRALASTDVIVECHNFADPRCTDLIVGYFKDTHDLRHVESGARDPNSFVALRTIGESDRWVAVCEYRPCTMNWVYCKSRA